MDGMKRKCIICKEFKSVAGGTSTSSSVAGAPHLFWCRECKPKHNVTDDEIREMFKLWRGGETLRAIGKRYGRSDMTISKHVHAYDRFGENLFDIQKGNAVCVK